MRRTTASSSFSTSVSDPLRNPLLSRFRPLRLPVRSSPSLPSPSPLMPLGPSLAVVVPLLLWATVLTKKQRRFPALDILQKKRSTPVYPFTYLLSPSLMLEGPTTYSGVLHVSHISYFLFVFCDSPPSKTPTFWLHPHVCVFDTCTQQSTRPSIINN